MLVFDPSAGSASDADCVRPQVHKEFRWIRKVQIKSVNNSTIGILSTVRGAIVGKNLESVLLE